MAILVSERELIEISCSDVALSESIEGTEVAEEVSHDQVLVDVSL
jgi:hypothetical protein